MTNEQQSREACDPHIISEMMMAYIDAKSNASHTNYAADESEERGMRGVLALLMQKGWQATRDTAPLPAAFDNGTSLDFVEGYKKGRSDTGPMGEDEIERLAEIAYHARCPAIKMPASQPWNEQSEWDKEIYRQIVRALLTAGGIQKQTIMGDASARKDGACAREAPGHAESATAASPTTNHCSDSVPGIRQMGGASAPLCTNSTSRESLPTSCESSDTKPQCEHVYVGDNTGIDKCLYCGKQILKSSDTKRGDDAEMRLIEQRDAAQDAADEMASLILGEDINWAFHDAKWAEAIEVLATTLSRCEVDRVARAIHDNARFLDVDHRITFDGLGPSSQKVWMKCAEAAIQSMQRRPVGDV